MKVSALQLVNLLAEDELAARFARRALIEVVGIDRADAADGSITDAEFDTAVEAIPSPSMEEHVKSAGMFGADPEESYMREVHAVGSAEYALYRVKYLTTATTNHGRKN